MDELTPRQAEVLRLISDFTQSTGFPPTQAEIARVLGFRSANAAEDHLKALARVSRLLRDRSLVEKLRATENADALYALLIETIPAQSAA